MNTNLELIRTKCIEANPEIIELKFGCEIDGTIWMDEYFNSPYIVYGQTWICKKHKKFHEECMAEEDGCSGEEGLEVRCGSEENWNEIRLEKSKAGKIIGRPIRLADVLLAIAGKGKMEDQMVYDDDGDKRSSIDIATLLCVYNLRKDDLNEQSEETINFLANLL